MDWIKTVRAYALQHQREIVDLPNGVGLKYKDGQDVFWIQPGEPTSTLAIPPEGPDVEAMLAEHERVSDLRGRVIHVIEHFVAEQAAKIRFGPLGEWECFNPDDVVGSVTAGVELTRVVLRVGDDIGEALRWVHGALVQPTSEQIETYLSRPPILDALPLYDDGNWMVDAQVPDALPDPPEVSQPAPESPPLTPLTAERVRRIGQKADANVEEWFARPGVLAKRFDPGYYDPRVDGWIAPDRWTRLAIERLGGKEGQAAALILLRQGDERGREYGRRFMRRYKPRHEESEFAVAIAWMMRHEFPAEALEWFGPRAHENYDDLSYDDTRAGLGDPVAIHRLREEAAALDPTDCDGLYSMTLVWAPEERVRECHAYLSQWVRTERRMAPPNVWPFRVAAEFGWRDIGEGVSENPFFLPGLLTIDPGRAELYADGLWWAADFLLVWSRVAPSRYVAEVLVTIEEQGLVDRAAEAVQRMMPRQDRLDGRSKLETAIAFAWKRCEPYL